MSEKKEVFKFCPLCRTNLEIKEIDGANRLTCPECGWVNYNNPLPVAVAVVKNSLGEILITKRAFDPAAGGWSFPGGFVESGEHPEKTCLRELREETAVEGKIKRFIGIHTYRSRVHGFLLVVSYEILAEKTEIKTSSEILEAKFVPPGEIPHLIFASHRKILKEIRTKSEGRTKKETPDSNISKIRKSQN